MGRKHACVKSHLFEPDHTQAVEVCSPASSLHGCASSCHILKGSRGACSRGLGMSLGGRPASSQCSLGAAGRPLQQGGPNGLMGAILGRTCWSKIADSGVMVNKVCCVAADSTCAACCQLVGLKAGLQDLRGVPLSQLTLKRSTHNALLHQSW